MKEKENIEGKWSSFYEMQSWARDQKFRAVCGTAVLGTYDLRYVVLRYYF